MSSSRTMAISSGYPPRANTVLPSWKDIVADELTPTRLKLSCLPSHRRAMSQTSDFLVDTSLNIAASLLTKSSTQISLPNQPSDITCAYRTTTLSKVCSSTPPLSSPKLLRSASPFPYAGTLFSPSSLSVYNGSVVCVPFRCILLHLLTRRGSPSLPSPVKISLSFLPLCSLASHSASQPTQNLSRPNRLTLSLSIASVTCATFTVAGSTPRLRTRCLYASWRASLSALRLRLPTSRILIVQMIMMMTNKVKMPWKMKKVTDILEIR